MTETTGAAYPRLFFDQMAALTCPCYEQRVTAWEEWDDDTGRRTTRIVKVTHNA